MLDLRHVLGRGHTREQVLVEHIEIAVEVYEQFLVLERFAVVGRIGTARRRSTARLQVLELLAAPERELEVQLVARHLHAPRVGQHDLRLLETLVGLVDNHAVEHARFGVLLFNVKVHVGHATVKSALGDFHGGRLLLHADEQRAQVNLRLGRKVVLKIKRHAGHQHREQHNRAHDAQQRYARCLHGQQFETFAHIAKRNQRGKEDGQRQSLRHERLPHVPEELRKNFKRQALANQFVHIAPRELHHKDEEADKECAEKDKQELFQNKAI